MTQISEAFREATATLELSGIRCREVAGRLTSGDSDVTPELTLSVQHRAAEGGLEFRFKLNVADESAEYLADIECRFEPIDGRDLPDTWSAGMPEDLAREFIERLVIMAAWPYLRETIASTAARLLAPVPTLGLLRAGQFELGESLTVAAQTLPH